MAYDIDATKMLEVLRIGREKLSDKGTTSAQKRVDPLRSQTGMAREAVIQVLVESFRKRHGGLGDGALRAGELALAERLVLDKFATPEWTAIVP
jgi:lipoate-protein ligase A